MTVLTEERVFREPRTFGNGVMKSLREWLQSVGLEHHSDKFYENGIDLDIVASLDDDDLRELGLTLGDRKRLLAASAKLAPADAGVDSQAAPNFSEGERRHLTVMFCDLVGSTELSQKLDPEALRELMREYQKTCGQVIDKYGGHVAQYLGDGLMTYFGWPRAHEDDAERAIRGALEIVEAVKQVAAPEPLRVRIGIATGPVVVGETGAGDASVPNVAVGETPNIAARIQGHAEADQIIIGPNTRKLVGGIFNLDDCGKHTLKGIVEPVRTWHVTGLASNQGRFDAAHGQSQLTPLVGREEELGILLRRWQLAQDGEGQVVLLCGEPGIGKSRMLRALREQLESESAKPIRFQCSPYYVNSAFWPSIDNFERALKFARNETPESKLDKLESLIVSHYQRPLADVRFVAAMLSIPCDKRYGELAMTPQKFKDETLRTLVDLTEGAANKQPCVLLFEDLHWSDPSMLEVLDLMIDRVKTIPLLIVLTHRPEFQNRWVDHGHVVSLNLSKLTRAQCAAMIAGVAGGKALPDDLLEQIIAKTDGVPLFVEELTKSILESGELTDAGDHYEYAGKSHSVTIPATLRDSLMARLDRFTPVKEIAQTGATIGREFSYELILAVAPLPTNQLDDALAQLTDSGLAFRRGTPPDATYTFKHALLQDAAYDSLLKSRRQELHGKIARVIEAEFPHIKQSEPETVAQHYTEAGATAQAVPYWIRAGQQAFSKITLTEAISHLEKALELLPTLPASDQRDRWELETRTLLFLAWEAFRGWPARQITETLRPALPLAHRSNDARILARTLRGLWVNPLTQGRIRESLSWAEDLLQSAEESKDDELFFTAHMAAMVTHVWLGNLLQAKQHGDLILSRYDASRHAHLVGTLNHDPKTLTGLYASHWEWMLGRPDQAAAMAEERDAHARTIGHPFDRGFALTTGSHVFEYRGDAERQFCSAADAERLGRDNSLPFISEVLAQVVKGVSLVKTGRAEEGITCLQPGLQAWDSVGAGIWSPYLKSILAEAYSLTGDISRGLGQVDAMLEQIARVGWEERVHLAEILRLKGWMFTLKDDLEGAEKCFLASIDCAREQQAKSWELRTSTSLARLWQQQGKRKEANGLLAPVYNWFTEGFDTKDLKEAKALLEELAQ